MTNSKQIKILVIFIVIIILNGFLYLNREKIHNLVVDEKVEIKSTPLEEFPFKSGREWYPVPVISCEEIFINQYHVTFENGITILTNKPSKIGDTTQCWVNNWYQSKIDNSLDSLVFQKPY